MQEEGRFWVRQMELYMHRIILMILLRGWFPCSYSQDWTITLPESIRALRGSCVEIPCTFTLPRDYEDFNLIWYKEKRPRSDNMIFSQQNSSHVNQRYRGRTSLVGNESNSCSLRINDVHESGTYYPFIHGNCFDSFTNNCQKIKVQLSGNIYMENIRVQSQSTRFVNCIVCKLAEHTCPSSPPTLQWDKAGYKLTERQERLMDGVWKTETVMEYLPSFQDHGTALECKATYQNGLVSKRLVTLHIIQLVERDMNQLWNEQCNRNKMGNLIAHQKQALKRLKENAAQAFKQANKEVILVVLILQILKRNHCGNWGIQRLKLAIDVEIFKRSDHNPDVVSLYSSIPHTKRMILIKYNRWQGILKGQFLPLQRNFSSDEEFLNETCLLQGKFLDKGYSMKAINDMFRIALETERSTLLIR
ncbi:hypothetical protein XELAEV_18036589mg [Xenopus laevis]|uniref:Immunoglobulin V-set domain-containing protein n=1 Tax=Xenopus laevis TaxID=8355 RepID=A0A974HD69_XENLA|nr:hypothetical protein XELAEV_18036589mg [Xenopus laevis]